MFLLAVSSKRLAINVAMMMTMMMMMQSGCVFRATAAT